MELGEKLRQARLEAGLSQRQLVGDRITRNMLSQIENGSAAPSMDTLHYLAQRLGKPLSFFLEDGEAEEAPLERAWRAYEAGDAAETLRLLEQHPEERERGKRERCLLRALALLRLAKESINIENMANRSKGDYACTLIDTASEVSAAAIDSILAAEGIIRVLTVF